MESRSGYLLIQPHKTATRMPDPETNRCFLKYGAALNLQPKPFHSPPARFPPWEACLPSPETGETHKSSLNCEEPNLKDLWWGPFLLNEADNFWALGEGNHSQTKAYLNKPPVNDEGTASRTCRRSPHPGECECPESVPSTAAHCIAA